MLDCIRFPSVFDADNGGFGTDGEAPSLFLCTFAPLRDTLSFITATDNNDEGISSRRKGLTFFGETGFAYFRDFCDEFGTEYTGDFFSRLAASRTYGL